MLLYSLVGVDDIERGSMKLSESIYCLKSESERYSEICNECSLHGKVGCDHCCDDALDVAILSMEAIESIKSIMCEVEQYEVSMDRPNKSDYDRVSADKFRRIWLAISELEGRIHEVGCYD